MFPVVLDLSRLPVALVGSADVARDRLVKLDSAGATSVTAYCCEPDAALITSAGFRLRQHHPDASELSLARVLLVAGLDDGSASELAATARALGVLVNVEDRTQWCDFHMPSTIRRGDLTVAVSTNGQSPRLARRVRRFIESLIGPEWADRVAEISRKRSAWRSAGEDHASVARLTDDLIDRRRWLP